jgi:hypothetical protein
MGLIDAADEAITLSGVCLNVTRLLRVIVQGSPQLFNGAVQTVFEIDINLGLPEPAAQFFSGDEFPRPLQQH